MLSVSLKSFLISPISLTESTICLRIRWIRCQSLEGELEKTIRSLRMDSHVSVTHRSQQSFHRQQYPRGASTLSDTIHLHLLIIDGVGPQGMIWFWLPASLVIMNDIAAYVCGNLHLSTLSRPTKRLTYLLAW